MSHADFEQMWRDLAPIGRSSETGGYFRQPWTPAERECVEKGMFRDVDPMIAAYAVLGVASWAAYWFQPGAGMTADDVAETLADIVLNGLRAY